MRIMKKKKKHLVIGLGEVGKAVKIVLAKKYSVDGIDRNSPKLSGRYDVLHICFPYSKKFNSMVTAYKKKYGTQNCLVIIHSTVPVGTTTKAKAVHSPIRGIHPFLAEGVKTFTKYCGGARADEAAEIFSALGIKTKTTPKAENTEALKLWDTTIYGWNILIEKEIHDFCKTHGLDFSLVYTDANQSYNRGYAALGHPEFKKFILKHMDGKIGGHCIIPNCQLLGTEIPKFILKQNRKLHPHT